MGRPSERDWRRRIPEVVLEVIARDGLEAASVRRIAKELGFSTAVVTHNFSDKHELLMWAYRNFVESANRRYHSVMAEDPADVVGFLMSMTALDEEDVAYWRAYVAIWDKSHRDETFAAELNKWIEEGVSRLGSFVRKRNPECADPDRASRTLLALVQGISVQRLFNESTWSVDQVRDTLTRSVGQILGEAASPSN